jgi:hypothetical protein
MLGLPARFFLELYPLSCFLEPEYFLLSRSARSLYLSSEPSKFLTCAFQSFLFGLQSFFFSAIITLSFRSEPFSPLKRTFMFFRAFLLFGGPSLQLFDAASLFFGMKSGFGLQAQTFLLNQPPGHFFRSHPLLYFL